MELSKQQACHFLLAHQRLSPAYPLRGKDGIRDHFRRVGCIQFDPLNITGQNADLVLQARVAEYRPELLRALLYEDRALLDGFDKVMSIYPVEDWPFFERWRERARNHVVRSHAAVTAAMPKILAAIEERGPLSSKELEMNETITWDWGTSSRLSRAALETLYFRGELVVHHKVHTRKYYDLARRCVPAELLEIPDPNSTEEDYQDWHVLRRVGSVGLLWDRAGEVWLGLLGVKSPERKAALGRLVEQGKLRQVIVAGIKDPFYYRTEDQETFEASLSAAESPDPVRLMAPLDNLLWDRRMLKALFDFEYTWEVYVPAAKRRYGYYVLPVLGGDRFIARCEPVLDRKRQALVLKNWWWEPGVEPGGWASSARGALERFAEVFGVKDLIGTIPT
ncbi:MAG TPA: crosslink repair DNA glycosylase YcaQ family protein [Anaerolineaceae bacterium]|nr:crosslink repair DNA glycosylase YcaQ family protein [Anaerolineaceae bacterium]